MKNKKRRIFEVKEWEEEEEEEDRVVRKGEQSWWLGMGMVWWWGGVACAQQDDLDTCYPAFLGVSVVWECSGYFMTNGTTLHLRVKVKCMHHTKHD